MKANNTNNFDTTLKLLIGGPRPPVILCIGSDRVIGDALGPLVGHMLTATYNIGAYVYGSLTSPVTALNLADTIDFIKRRHPDNLIVAVDSSIGNEEEIGIIKVNKGGIYPGSAVGKKLPYVGNVSVTAIVSHRGISSGALNNVRLGLIHSLACRIAASINNAVTTRMVESA